VPLLLVDLDNTLIDRAGAFARRPLTAARLESRSQRGGKERPACVRDNPVLDLFRAGPTVRRAWTRT